MQLQLQLQAQAQAQAGGDIIMDTKSQLWRMEVFSGFLGSFLV